MVTQGLLTLGYAHNRPDAHKTFLSFHKTGHAFNAFTAQRHIQALTGNIFKAALLVLHRAQSCPPTPPKDGSESGDN